MSLSLDMVDSIDSKLPGVGTTIFTVMSQLATETGAINLAQGFPSFDAPAALTDRISYHLNHGANQYAPMTGVQSLREAIAAKTARVQGRNLDAIDEVTICAGATEGLFSAIQTIVRPGDEVIVFDPAYDAYEPAVRLAGGTTRHVPFIASNATEFAVDWQRFSDSLNDKTRLVVLNFPHNPTGSILSASDLDRFADILRNTSAFLLADEVYEHVVFDGQKHRSLASHDELWERSFVVSSFGKTFHATGWRVGYCLAPSRLSAEFRKVHQFVTFAVSTPMQCALADYLVSNPEFYEDLSGFYQHKRDLFCRLLERTRFRYMPARSTFFQIVDYGDISREQDIRLSDRWTREHGVASIPLTPFYKEDYSATRLRFCFAKDDATLIEAVGRLAAL